MAETPRPPFDPLVAPVDSSDWEVRPGFELHYKVVPCRGGITAEDIAFIMGMSVDELREELKRG